MDHLFRAFRCSDLENHIECRTWCSSMQWALESANRSGNRRDQVRVRRNDYACGKCRSIKAVITHRIQISLQPSCAFLANLAAKHLMEAILGVRQISARFDRFLPALQSPIRADDCRKRCDERSSILIRGFAWLN